jgi:acetylornithine/succinyldiaminopimelate/putrescine aminotransferase
MPLRAALARLEAAGTGALVIADEVQSATWRTGTFLHSGTIGLAPDLVALAKALGAGAPVGAVLLSDRVAGTISPGDHGTTYGGNLLACRAALTFLDVVDAGVGDAMRRVSPYLFDRLHALAADHAGRVAEVRGAGFIAGLDLKVDAGAVVAAALERGLVINRTSGTVVRLLPPYIATEADVDEAIAILGEALRHAS